MELEPGSDFAGYRIEKLIARGGMGVVYRAVEISLGRQVVVKILPATLAADPAYRVRFEQEARLAASVEHPNIVPIYSSGVHEDTLYIAMRYIRGPDLQELINSYGAVDVEQTRTMITQIAAALDHIHAQGMVHRDVKTANVLVGVSGEDAGRAYLADFGVARAATSDRNLTTMGAFLGTREYASPEQLSGEDVDWRTDIYALGCVIYECLTGTPPFADRPSPQLAHMMDPPPVPTAVTPALPRGVDAVVATAMAKSRDARYPSAGKLAEALTKAIRGDTAAVPPTTVEAAQVPAETPVAPVAPVVSPPPATTPVELPEKTAPISVQGESGITPRISPSATPAVPQPSKRPPTVVLPSGPVGQPSPPSPPPPPSGGPREIGIPGSGRRVSATLVAGAGVAAFVLVILVGVALLHASRGNVRSSPPASSSVSAPQTTATPADLRATQGLLAVQLRWDPPSSGDTSGYRIMRNGTLLATVPGTAYTDKKNIQPGRTYAYEVLAVQDGVSSNPVRRSVLVKRPSLGAARVAGVFAVHLQTTQSAGFTRRYGSYNDAWAFRPLCAAGPCSARWRGLGKVPARAVRRSGKLYRISLAGKIGNTCNTLSGQALDITSDVVIGLRVVRARAMDGRWEATSLHGSMSLVDPAQLGCSEHSATQRVTARLTGG